MNIIDLWNLELKTFTEQNILDYCLLNNINCEDIKILYLDNNKLTDISGIKLFKNTETLWLYKNKIKDISVLKDLNNLKKLYLGNNQIKDISVIKDLTKLQLLDIGYLELEFDQIKYIQSLKNLEDLWCENGFKDMSVLNELNKNT